jgi:hypothetical protein
MASRAVLPELLDALPPDDPRAIRSRADLRRVNRWMGQARLMTRLLRGYGRSPPRRMLEIGCGDGSFMLRVARNLAPQWPGVHLQLLDRQSLVSPAALAGFAAIGWRAETVTADVFDLAAVVPEQVDIVSANLFLHHFEATDLQRLLGVLAATTSYIAACEPRRAPLALLGSRLLLAIGCNDVTRHDAVTSVRAGFTGQDLALLWPQQAHWRIEERAAGLFTHVFVARKEIGLHGS